MKTLLFKAWRWLRARVGAAIDAPAFPLDDPDTGFQAAHRERVDEWKHEQAVEQIAREMKARKG